MTSQTPRINFDDTRTAFAHLSDDDLRKAYWMFKLMNHSWLVKCGNLLTKIALRLHLPIDPLIRRTVFQHFCGGETIAQCHETIQKLSAKGVGTILDYSVEGEDTETSFDSTLQQLLATIRFAASSPDVPFAVFKVTGLSRASLLEKWQTGARLSGEEGEELTRARNRIFTLCQTAANYNVRIFFDAEESWIQDSIDLLCQEMMETFNKTQALIYNTYQFYRRDMIEKYQNAYRRATELNYFLGAKLVRGAYMEKEAMRAEKNNYPNPLNTSKRATDQDFDEAVRFSLLHLDRVAICLGTHNELSCERCVREMHRHAISKKDPRIFFAQLVGMSDNISFNMALAGYNVAKYVPFGPIKAVMPYLFRRANENTAIAGQSSREYLLIARELQRRKSTTTSLS